MATAIILSIIAEVLGANLRKNDCKDSGQKRLKCQKLVK
jgi:hypothetical protein